MLLFASLIMAACQGPLSSGIRAFEESRFVHAAEVLRQVESGDLSPEDSARWALYLGLSELSLGNLSQAIFRLCAARLALQNSPDALSPIERGQLESAWQTVGRMPSEPLTRAYRCSE